LHSFRAKVAAVAALVLVLTPTARLSQQSAGKLSITVRIFTALLSVAHLIADEADAPNGLLTRLRVPYF